MNMPYIEHTG